MMTMLKILSWGWDNWEAAVQWLFRGMIGW